MKLVDGSFQELGAMAHLVESVSIHALSLKGWKLLKFPVKL